VAEKATCPVAFFLNMLLAMPFAAALNHLLEADPWARERLAGFPGETLELRAPPLPALRFAIRPGGLLDSVAAQGEPTVALTFRAQALFALARHGVALERRLLEGVEVRGNPRLATEVLALLRHLDWDAEEDLSRLVGDVAAHRIGQAGRDLAAWQADATRRLAASLADYAAQEKGWLVHRSELEEFAEVLGRLREQTQGIDARVRRLG
jgi:ubiquinone biosynthesis accessory factor UbiJ